MKNLINIVRFILRCEVTLTSYLRIRYGETSISIYEDRIEITSPIQRFTYDYSYSNCDDWFINSSKEQKEIYQEAVCLEQ